MRHPWNNRNRIFTKPTWACQRRKFLRTSSQVVSECRGLLTMSRSVKFTWSWLLSKTRWPFIPSMAARSAASLVLKDTKPNPFDSQVCGLVLMSAMFTVPFPTALSRTSTSSAAVTERGILPMCTWTFPMMSPLQVQRLPANASTRPYRCVTPCRGWLRQSAKRPSASEISARQCYDHIHCHSQPSYTTQSES
jgi:hypothetical protein